MDEFRYRNGELHCEDVPAEKIARDFGTPCYVYSSKTILDHYGKLRDAFAPAAAGGEAPIICYSVKANSNLSLLKLMKDHGSGFDVVSGGELFRALKVGADPKTIVFAGVGKTDEEFRYGLEQDILLFNVESEPELEALDRVAGSMKKKARAAIRINPDVDPDTHTYIATGKKETKFGIDLARSYVVGDKLSDIECAQNAGALGILVHTGYGQGELANHPRRSEVIPDHQAPDLIDAAAWIVSRERGRGAG